MTWVRSFMGQIPHGSVEIKAMIQPTEGLVSTHVTRSFAQLNKQSTQLTLCTFFLLFFSIFIFCCNCVFVMFRHRQWLKTGVYLSKTPTSGKIKDSYATNSFLEIAEKRKMPERISCTKQRGTCRLSVRQRRKRRGRRWDEDIWSSTVTPGGMNWKETALVSHHHNRDVLSLKAHNNYNKMPVCVRLCKMHLFVCEQVYFPQPNITHAPGEIKVAETASKAVCTCTFAWVRFVHMPVGFVFFNFIYYVCPSITASATDIPKTEDVVHHWFLSVHLTHTFICLVFFFPWLHIITALFVADADKCSAPLN